MPCLRYPRERLGGLSSTKKTAQIVSESLPGPPRQLTQQVKSIIEELRGTGLYKIPGLSESRVLTSTLTALTMRELGPESSTTS